MDNKIVFMIGIISMFSFIGLVSGSSFFEGGAEFSGGSSSASSVTHQYSPSYQAIYGPGDKLNEYWPILGDRDTCEAREDIVLQVAPFGCQPSVVRSDLLASQNVPVFCQIDALQLNPLIDIKQIRGISFGSEGGYPDGIVGTGFHPARAALRTRDKLLGSPLINNIGYVVIVLKKNEVEKSLPESINVTLTARLDFDVGNAYGIGRAEFVLNEMSDSDWENEKDKNSFWNGRYFVRLENAEPDFAIVSLYSGDRKISTLRVEKGKTSRPVYVPGEYCRAGVEVNYDGYVASKKKATIEIGNQDGTDIIDLYEGSSFLSNKCRVNNINVLERGFGDVKIKCEGLTDITLGVKPLNNDTNVSFVDDDLGGDAEREFNDAIDAYELIVNDYPSERDEVEGKRVFAEEALRGAIEFVKNVEDKTKKSKAKTRYRLLSRYVEMYPNGGSIGEYEKELRDIFYKDVSRRGHVVEIGNTFYTIRLKNLVSPNEAESSSATFRIINGGEINIAEDSEKNLSKEGVVQKIRLDKVVSSESVEITPFCWVDGKDNKRVVEPGDKIVLREGDEPKDICKTERIRLSSVDLVEIAKIRLNSLSQGNKIETKLNVNIGIEKRAIKLSTSKTQEVIENLNKSIEKWEKINDGLGKIVTGLKGACLATAGVLTVKNFFDGIGGGALARTQAMEGQNGWKNRCKEAVDFKEIDRGSGGGKVSVDYKTMTECFNNEKKYIEAEISARKNVNEEVNGVIKGIEDSGDIKTGDSISGYSVDEGKARALYYAELKKKFPNEPILNEIGAPNDNGASYSYKDLRELHTTLLLKEKRVSSGVVGKSYADLSERFSENAESFRNYNKDSGSLVRSYQVNLRGDSKDVEAKFVDLKASKDKIVGGDISSSDTYAVVVNGYSKVENGKAVESGDYMIVGQKQAGQLVPSKIYKVSEGDGKFNLEPAGDVTLDRFMTANNINSFKSVDRDLIGNQIATNYKKIRFFETGPDKGLPAIVPFDINQGWYVRVNSNLKIGNQLAAYDSSGLPKNWNICNVGGNGAIDMEDDCQLVSRGYSGQILGLDSRKSQKLIQDSQRALLDASSQYGENVIRVNGQEFFQGAPVTPFDSVQCQDYMGIDDCKILFNVCDPVICPASRCNFGGEFPVSDVIQTGIVGGALLCLPNYREGIVAPVCLTGIHAGIDGYVSVMKNYRDCLGESLETGRLVGMCDYLYSVYMCDFFWNQMAPVANVLLPKAVELATGQVSGGRGGGEYLNVQSAWDNAGKSVDYFTQSYAVNSLKAFNLRDSSDVGTQFCKAFVSSKSPDSFKGLVEPESPPQFHAWFSSTTYSDVTVPATAQYKVFYHIFAGNDVGTHYSVYLKSPPESSYYNSVPTILVSTGFAGRGQYASETKEFTAPEGYKELCVRVNDQEECGFEKVSTSFALNYLGDKLASETINQNEITSEAGCVSGGMSPVNLGSAVSPNIQASTQSALFPQDYNRGIVRICSTKNPGGGTEPARYTEVGYCGEKNMKCWLDSKSVDNAITDNNRGVRDETLNEIEKAQIENIKSDGKEVYTGDEAKGEIGRYKEEINVEVRKLDKIDKISDSEKNVVGELLARGEFLFEKLFYNHHKAEHLLSSARLRSALAGVFVRGVPVDSGTSGSSVGSGSEDDEIKSADGTNSGDVSVGGEGGGGGVGTSSGDVSSVITFSLERDYKTEALENYIMVGVGNGALVKSGVYIKSGEIWIVNSYGAYNRRGVVNDKTLNIVSSGKANVNSAVGDTTGKEDDYYEMLNGAIISGENIILASIGEAI